MNVEDRRKFIELLLDYDLWCDDIKKVVDGIDGILKEGWVKK